MTNDNCKMDAFISAYTMIGCEVFNVGEENINNSKLTYSHPELFY